MMRKRYAFCLFLIILSSLVGPVTSNQERQAVISQSEMTEYRPVFSDLFRLATSSQHTGDISLSCTSGIMNEQESEAKSSYVIMTTVNFTEKIYINENEIIEIWSQNISSQSRTLYHKLSGTYPDGSPLWGESDHIVIQPGKWLHTYFTVYNTGKGIGIFNFTCEVWEDMDPYSDTLHDWESHHYTARFYKPFGVNENYYCDDQWHHPSDSEIYEEALRNAGGKTSPRDGLYLEPFSVMMAVKRLIYVTHTAAQLDINYIHGLNHTIMALFIM